MDDKIKDLENIKRVTQKEIAKRLGISRTTVARAINGSEFIKEETKTKILELALKGHELKNGKDLVKDPFVLEFLDIKENIDYLESDLEKNILEHLKEFLLELGKGFMFVGSQVRLTLEEDHFYPDKVNLYKM